MGGRRWYTFGGKVGEAGCLIGILSGQDTTAYWALFCLCRMRLVTRSSLSQGWNNIDIDLDLELNI